jgi:hypothetical protein
VARWHGVEKIVTGGQTGVDRAALDVALELRIPCGGWCPMNRRAEDGMIPDHYPLQETPTTNYAERTALNVRDSHGTLILVRGALRGGTALTKTFAERYRRPCLVVDLRSASEPTVIEWLHEHPIKVLNIAGPRESSQPGITQAAGDFLRALFRDQSHRSDGDTGRRRVRRSHFPTSTSHRTSG